MSPASMALRMTMSRRGLAAAALQQAVNSALAQIYRSSALPDIYNRWFGALGRPSAVLEVMFALGRLPQ